MGTASGMGVQTCPLTDSWNLPSKLCRDAKTDRSMVDAHVASRRMPAMKPVGERSAGNPHAAFDERGGETGLPQAEPRSEEHTSELQSHLNIVCRLLLEKKK